MEDCVNCKIYIEFEVQGALSKGGKLGPIYRHKRLNAGMFPMTFEPDQLLTIVNLTASPDLDL